MAADTPSEPLAPWPPGAFQSLLESKVQSAPAVAFRYLVKFSDVPEESERCTATIGVAGSVAFGLSALIAASSQLLTVPAKILARVAGFSCRSLTPLRLNATAIGPVTIG